LYSWLSEHKALMLYGPPGSGKTTTLFSTLRKLPDMEVVGLNFSRATTPELILKTFEQPRNASGLWWLQFDPVTRQLRSPAR
ncbi:hypothetical protein M405DRAFT_809051, partial [Rhizopogon salebrosus TDB-379]